MPAGVDGYAFDAASNFCRAAAVRACSLGKLLGGGGGGAGVPGAAGVVGAGGATGAEAVTTASAYSEDAFSLTVCCQNRYPPTSTATSATMPATRPIERWFSTRRLR